MLPATVNSSPMIVFDVSDVQASLTRLLSLGAEMDGAIQYSLEGNKVGALIMLLYFSFCGYLPSYCHELSARASLHGHEHN